MAATTEDVAAVTWGPNAVRTSARLSEALLEGSVSARASFWSSFTMSARPKKSSATRIVFVPGTASASARTRE